MRLGNRIEEIMTADFDAQIVRCFYEVVYGKVL